MRLRDMPRDLLVLTFAMIIANISGAMVQPLLPLYLETLGASVQNIGFYFTMQIILAIVFRILGGWISDNMGRLPTIAVGGLMGMAARLAFVLAPTWEWALVGGLFTEMGISLVAPSFQAYTAERAPKGSMSSTFGIVNALFLICMIIGPVMGGLLAREYGYKTMYWVAIGIFAIATVMRVYMAWGESWNVRTMKAVGLGRDLRGLIGVLLAGGLLTWLFLIDGFTDASMQLSMPFIPKYVTEIGRLDEVGYGILTAIMSITAAVAMIPGGRFSDRFGERIGMAVGMGGFAVIWMIFVMASTPLTFAIAFALAGFARAFIEPALSALLSKAAPKQSLGITWGVFMTAMGVLAIPAPYIGGLLYKTNPAAPFLTAAVMLVIAIPMVLWKLRVPADEPEQADVPAEALAAASVEAV